MTSHSPQNGNVFFIILLAIALFAGLTFAVMQGSRTGASALSGDQAKLAAMEIISYGDAVAKTVQTLRLRDCGLADFDFGNTTWQDDSGNPINGPGSNPSAKTECNVFDASAGKMTAQLAPSDAVMATTTPPGSDFRHWEIITTILPGKNKQDVLLHLPQIKPEVCQKINETVGVRNPGGSPPEAITTAYSYYSGNIVVETGGLNMATNDIDGKTSFCMMPEYMPGGSYFRVLITR